MLTIFAMAASAANPPYQSALDQAIAWMIPNAINAAFALVILVVGLFIANWIRGKVRRAVENSKRIDSMLAGFFSSLVYYLILAVIGISVLKRFGVDATSLAAVFGAVGLAIGLALQGTLSHLASGVMLLIFRPFQLGDYIEVDGMEGTVKEISLFTTELATVDNRKIIMPNGKVWDNSIVNFTANQERRLDMIFGISYDDNIDDAMKILRDIVAEDDRCFNAPEPIIAVVTLNDYSVDITCRVWCKSSHYWYLKWDLLKKVKEEFDAKGITIPFPTAVEYQGEVAG